MSHNSTSYKSRFSNDYSFLTAALAPSRAASDINPYPELATTIPFAPAFTAAS